MIKNRVCSFNRDYITTSMIKIEYANLEDIYVQLIFLKILFLNIKLTIFLFGYIYVFQYLSMRL